MSNESIAPPSFEWLPTTCAPRRYPVEVFSGALLHNEESGAVLEEGSVVCNGWGESGSLALIGEAIKPLPTVLDLIWFSYVENAFYNATVSLPVDRLEAMFKQGARGANGDKIPYDRAIVGMAPGVETRMMAYYAEKFPALVPLIVYHELGTPLATAKFTAHEKGGFYGLEMTPRRVLSEALSPRTPVPGLFLSGQDALTPGIAGAMWGGMLCASSIDPRVFKKLG